MKTFNPIILILVFLCVLSTNLAQGRKDTTITYCDFSWNKTSKSKAQYIQKSFVLRNGTFGVERYTMSGVPVMKGAFDTKKLLTKEGYFVWYNYAGDKQKEGKFEENRETGIWQYWHPNGTISSKGEYKKGRRTGMWKNWTEEGVLMSEMEYDYDELNGSYTTWRDTVMVKSGSYLKGEKVGEWFSWFEDGAVDYEGTFDNGDRVGEWNFYHKNGTLASKETYEKGEAVEVRWWNESGEEMTYNKEELFVDPSYPEGEQAMMNFIQENINYPDEAFENGEQGIVYIGFIVEPDGSLSTIKPLRGVSKSLDDESIRVIKLMPKWEPGFDHNRILPVRYTLPIHFRLG